MMKNKRLGKYVDIRTDFGMKFYFGREENKILLIEFLNCLFEGRKIIKDLRYTSIEQDGEYPEIRRAIFDLYCIGQDGEHFIVEMQQLYQEYFKDRAVFYTSRLINRQLARGRIGNNYQLPEVYFIGILEFSLQESQGLLTERTTDRPYFHDVALCDRYTHEVFYNKLGYKLVSLPDFQKSPDELDSVMDQWLYLLKHLSTMDKLPTYLDKRIFSLIFDVGQIGKLTKQEFMSYEASLKHKRDARSLHTSAINTGLAKGREEGRKEGAKKKSYEVVAKLLDSGKFTIAEIANYATVTEDFVRKTQTDLDGKK